MKHDGEFTHQNLQELPEHNQSLVLREARSNAGSASASWKTCKNGSKLKRHRKVWHFPSDLDAMFSGMEQCLAANVAFWCFLYGEIHVLRCFRCDLTNEPKQKLGHSPTFCERQSHHANEARRSVQDGAIGEVCVLAIAKSEQYVTDELDQHHEIQAFSWLLIGAEVGSVSSSATS